MVRLFSWSLGNVKYPFINIFSGSLWPKEVVPVKSPTMGKKWLLNFLQGIIIIIIIIIIISDLKPFSCVQVGYFK